MSYTGKDNLNVMNLAINYNNYIFKWLNVKQYTNILDFGAGNGEYCNRINIDTIVAIELDNYLRSKLTCKSYENLSKIKDLSIDLIYTLNVLEHIENDLNIVKKLVGKLNNNGIIKILVPAKMELYSKMDKKVGHFRRYEKNELIKLINQSNLELIEYRYFDFLGYFISLLYKYIDNSGEINTRNLIIYDKIIFPISIFIDKITFGKIIGKNLMIIARKKC
jgi:predicted SAM-dependent methyltransferase